MSGYIGTQPVPQATQTRDSFTATSGQTSFATGGYTPNFLDVYLNGVKLASADYTATNGSDVVLASGAATGDILEVVAYTAFDTANVTGATNFTVTGAFTSQGIDDNGNATAITIDGNENVLVGQTTNALADTGHILDSTGTAYHIRDGASPLILNRKSSDGSITEFYKDGTTVGSVGAHSSGTYLGTADTGIYFNGGNDSIDPYNPSVPINRDNAISLGAGSRRFKDLYLSGGVYLGGTGSANKLEDYEEGSFTPTFSSGFTSISYALQSGHYVKVGRLVTIQVQIKMNSATASGSIIRIAGLPFNAAGYSDSTYGGFYPTYNGGFNTNTGDTYHKTANNANIQVHTNTGAGRLGSQSGISTSSEIILSGSYYTNS